MRKRLLFILIICAPALLAAQTPPPESAIITNSGSTNTAGFTITVRSDGTGTLSVQHRALRAVAIPHDVTERFFTDLQAVRAQNPPPQFCMKSASFGSRTSIAWRGWSSPDVQCPPRSANMGMLATDVKAIEAAAGVAPGMLHRIGLPPDIRKIPSETPEVQPT